MAITTNVLNIASVQAQRALIDQNPPGFYTLDVIASGDGVNYRTNYFFRNLAELQRFADAIHRAAHAEGEGDATVSAEIVQAAEVEP